ncbi:hypothetical protein M8C13_05380 [Crossiella sp. SN42]|uniref:hypothetical protein n=1 Tax=Crossiella sp. SN42 TaxID=2944808 RepID=UPI00207CFFF5|nr:hypothetical protein [Crossiella sp. SN42]MCO1575191.1 hypothetical protein [Crossiella sp. SN42]
MPRIARAPIRLRNRWDRLALQILLFSAAAEPPRRFPRKRRRVRRGGDEGVETVEIAIGIALAVGVALLVWAAYKVFVQKYLNQLP